MTVGGLVDRIVERSQAILTDDDVGGRDEKFKIYAISNFRGGIGKSTLSFNIAYEVSRSSQMLLLDTCPQRNFSQNILGEDIREASHTLYNSLVSQIAGTSRASPDDLLMHVNVFCPAFKTCKKSFMVPGSTELYLFPSLLYSTLAQYAQLQGGLGIEASRRVVNSIRNIIDEVTTTVKVDKILIDTSPFFGGATHLGWAAADALIIPVRVDQHSIEALGLTLEMLTNKEMDFHKFNRQAGIDHAPVVHAIVMTLCGWSRQKRNTPDSSTRFFVEKAVEVALKYEGIFSDSVEYCFYLMDDFHSCGRISGKQRIPISRLESGKKYPVDNQRLEVNPSVDRYKKEIRNLALDL